MPVHSFFPTRVYVARLQPSGWQALNRRLLRESLQLREDDRGGREWSKTHYPGGYTSYGSLCRMHTLSPTFATLGRKLRRHVLQFARALDFDLDGRDLAMTDCWVNIMPRGVTHSAHLHPLSTISGTYYVRTPTRFARAQVRGPATRSLHGRAAAQGAASPREPSLGDGARVGRQRGAVRELAAARGGAESGGGRAHQHQLQLQLVLSDSSRTLAAGHRGG